MKPLFSFLLVTFTAVIASQGAYAQSPAINAAGVTADHSDLSYGPHSRNIMDVWLAESDEPSPMVVCIHGGGFKNNDKSSWHNSPELVDLLEQGISVATINYRYVDQTGDMGVLGCLNDCALAVQYIRSRADEWNLDSSRFGGIGGSAGAGSCLWLATHPDLVDLNSDDPVAQQSSRLQAIGLTGTQATYNFDHWITKIEELYPAQQAAEVVAQMTPTMLQFYGLPDDGDIDSIEAQAIKRELDMLAWMSADDAAIWVDNGQGRALPQNKGQLLHHAYHAIAVGQKAKRVGLDVEYRDPYTGETPILSRVDFIAMHLLFL